MLEDDLANIFADTSLTVSVEYGASPVQVTRGLPSGEDVPEPDGGGGIVIVARKHVTIAVGALTGLRNDQPIVVDGVTYKIHNALDAGRGKLKVVIA